MTGERIMTTDQMKELIGRFEFHKRGISEHRDALRDLADEVHSLADDTDGAVADLNCAIDALSKYV